MYESYFGLSGAPFQLNPDPAFFFDSRGHRHALAYLKYGAHQGEGFIVVTGEIGAGKTTVVRTLMQSLDPEVVAAQIVSTQLGSGDLLRSILIAFGVPTAGESKAQLISTIEAFLTQLAAQGRRALLIIDEAQNLGRESIEELRMLSNFQLGTHALMQSFLVGQPELRTLLKSRSMEQLRQRVTASCHLEALDAAETRHYIEHRLRHVGWQEGRPEFTVGAHERIHAWTAGIPRRINRLCNRLLLSAYLAETSRIDEALVVEAADELRAEVGEFERSAGPPSGFGAFVEAAAPDLGTAPGLGPMPVAAAAARRGPGLVCVCDSPAGYWKLVSLARALAADLPGVPLAIVHSGGERSVGGLPDFAVPPGCTVAHLGVAQGDFAKVASTAIPRFEMLLREWAGSALLVIGHSDCALACALLGSKQGLPVVRVDAGLRGQALRGAALNAALIDRIADELFTRGIADSHVLVREGRSPERVHVAGSLAAAFMQQAQAHLPSAHAVLEEFELPVPVLEGRYGVIAWPCPPAATARRFVERVLPVLRVLTKDVPLVWPVRATERTGLIVAGVDHLLSDAGVTVVRERGYIESLALLQHARCLVCEAGGTLSEEASMLGKLRLAAGTDTGDAAWQDDEGQIVVGLDPELAARALRALAAGAAADEAPPDDAAPAIAHWLARWFDAGSAQASAPVSETVE